MKKLLLLCLLAIGFGSKPAAAYDYVPLVREGVEWGYACENPTSICGELTYYRLQFNGTTEINGKTYHNLLKYQTYTYYESEIVAFMREEDKKVYIILKEVYDIDKDQKESLIFDFGHKEGDKSPELEFSGPRECIETGFVDTANGPRRYMKFSRSYLWDYDMLVEGIGPYNSDPEYYYFGGSIYKPYCFYVAAHPNPTTYDILLYERELPEDHFLGVKGKIIWENPICFKALGAHDPSVWRWGNYNPLGEVENTMAVGTDVEIKVENNAVSVGSSTTDILFIETYDFEGRLLSTMKPVNNSCRISLASVGGAAIIKVTTTTGVYSTKVATK